VTALQLRSMPVLPCWGLKQAQNSYRSRRRAFNGEASPITCWTRPDIKHTSVYLPEAAYEALRQVAFDERCKIHDLLMEGVELALKKRGYPALGDMKAKWERKKP
jgi:hypothetical protein